MIALISRGPVPAGRLLAFGLVMPTALAWNSRTRESWDSHTHTQPTPASLAHLRPEEGSHARRPRRAQVAASVPRAQRP